jgi:hypothetical protein
VRLFAIGWGRREWSIDVTLIYSPSYLTYNLAVCLLGIITLNASSHLEVESAKPPLKSTQVEERRSHHENTMLFSLSKLEHVMLAKTNHNLKWFEEVTGFYIIFTGRAEGGHELTSMRS